MNGSLDVCDTNVDENEKAIKKRKIIVSFHVVMTAIAAVWWHERCMVKESSQNLRIARQSPENWDDICVPFAQDRATGEGAQTAVEVDCEMTTNESNNLEETLDTLGSREALDDNDDDATNIPTVQQGRSNVSSSSSQRKRQRNSDGLHTVLGRMADSLERFLDSDNAKVTTEMVLQEVSKVPDLDRRQLLRVVDLMMHDVKKFEIFLGLPNDLKKEWIMMHLGQ